MIDVDNDHGEQQLKNCIKLLTEMFGNDLLGIYLYGSALVGGLQRYSDIDILVIINRTTTLAEKTKLVECFLKLSGIYMAGSAFPLEITIVEKCKVNPWRYIPHFDFQYGEWLRASFEKGIIAPWSTCEMADLALIITQVLLKSLTLWGSQPESLLVRVPYHDFIKAILHDQKRLAEDLQQDTRNVLLTYARTWSTLETNAIRSKSAAADWVINHLPIIYKPVMRCAKSIYIGAEEECWDDVTLLIKPCADFMVAKINEKGLLVNLDDANNIIKLADAPDHERDSKYR